MVDLHYLTTPYKEEKRVNYRNCMPNWMWPLSNHRPGIQSLSELVTRDH
uniref:Uncharacterized protein n=1 Tax=Setaria italica TaxID=4555 RepID=K4ANE1_SETIT